VRLTDEIKRSRRPFVIAGPCSAETEEQVIQTAQTITADDRVRILRAGIWKPRTRPNSFEGLGEKALPWLVKAGEITGRRTTTEVANSKHVEMALNAGVDILWVGARTTVNPFAVQEIADALRGSKVPVMIKNPVNPDLSLWMGAFERFERVGLDDLTAIHRGFSVYSHPKYRNIPRWEIPIAFKEERPSTPIIVDPSHITGNRDLLAEVSQKALDLDFEGLMIETHPDPENALSDQAQQLTPHALLDLIDKLILRSKDYSKDVAEEIAEIRQKVETLDDRMFEILSERMKMSERVGELKRTNNITILQQAHWTRVINSRLEGAQDFGLTKKFVRQLMDAIHQESIRHQTSIMNPYKKGEDE
jgi:chorismate mutase